MVLIEGTEIFIIGGYTTKDWDTSGNWYKDDNCFLFSLTKGKKFPKIIKDQYSIRGAKDNRPWFGFIGFESKVKGNLSQGKYYYRNKIEMVFENYDEIIPNGNHDRLFNVKEVEIFKIENNIWFL